MNTIDLAKLVDCLAYFFPSLASQQADYLRSKYEVNRTLVTLETDLNDRLFEQVGKIDGLILLGTISTNNKLSSNLKIV